MRKGILVFLCCAALLAGGCASKQAVKSEESMAKAAPAGSTATATPPATGTQISPPALAPTPSSESAAKAEAPRPVTETPAQESAVAQESARQAQESARQAQKAAELKGALETIYFDFDSATLSEAARNALAQNAQYLTRHPELKVRIEGNCDERGSDEYNLALGERRAKSALEYLVTLGVPADRLSTISYGEEKPVDPGHDDAAWAKNRRDEFAVIK